MACAQSQDVDGPGAQSCRARPPAQRLATLRSTALSASGLVKNKNRRRDGLGPERRPLGFKTFQRGGRRSADPKGSETASYDRHDGSRGQRMGMHRGRQRFRKTDFCGRRYLNHDIAPGIHLDRVMAIRYNWKETSRLVSINQRKNKFRKSSIRSKCCDRSFVG